MWGGQLDGCEGTVRPLPERLTPVISLTVDLIRSGVGTKFLLSVIAGFFVAAFQFRRRFMSLLEEVFKTPAWIREHAVFALWPSLMSELWCLVILSPLVATNLRAQFSEDFVATDASDLWKLKCLLGSRALWLKSSEGVVCRSRCGPGCSIFGVNLALYRWRRSSREEKWFLATLLAGVSSST